MLVRTRAALFVACAVAVAAAAQDDIVDWRDAERCVGHVCSVRGTVVLSEVDGPTFRLYFDSERRGVRVLLMRGWLVTWPHYEGATIVATGKLRRFRDHIEMILLSPDDIQVVDAAPATATAAADTATPTAISSPTATSSPNPTATVVAPVDSPTPRSEPTAAATLRPTPAPSEVEQLRQRVRELEERVRELEQH